jgi:deoxyribodipyrimidine photo-lyase
MQRAERVLDNPALDVAVEVANALDLPVLVYFSAISNFPHANLRHYAFLNQGLADIEEDLAQRQIGSPAQQFSADAPGRSECRHGDRR